IDGAQFLEDLCADGRRLDFAATSFQIVHDFINQLLEGEQTGGAFLESFGDAARELATVERFMGAVPFYHAQVRAFDLLVSGEASDLVLVNTKRYAATAWRGAIFFGFRSANSKPTFPFSNVKCAENGRPFFETNFGSRSVLPVAISFWTCSFAISRCKMFLLMRNVHVFSLETAFSQA